MSTLGTSFGARIRDMDYKTLRYPGHFAAMRWLLELGMMSDVPIAHAGGTIVPRAFLRQQLESALPICSRDRTIVRVVMRGGAVPGGEQVIDVDETHDEVTNLTAMARLTAWPATAISLMQARGDVTPGALAQERSINPDRFFELLDEQGLKIPVLAATQSA
jgi:saccharopine dehydrogenase-like NADP-dependent oxidoreductase